MKLIIDTTTGEELERELTQAEIAQLEIDQALAATQKAAEEDAENKKEIAKAKLAALGLTEDDLIAIGLIAPAIEINQS